MPRKRVDVEKGLLTKGFRRREGDHHYYNYFNTQGKKNRRVHQDQRDFCRIDVAYGEAMQAVEAHVRHVGGLPALAARI